MRDFAFFFGARGHYMPLGPWPMTAALCAVYVYVLNVCAVCVCCCLLCTVVYVVRVRVYWY